MADTTVKTLNSIGDSVLGIGETQKHPFRVLLTVNPKAAALLLPNSTASGQAQLGFTKISIKRTTNIDITNWVTSLSWTCSVDEKYISVNVSLDNFGGLFNQVPAGSRIIIQVRKPFFNFTGLSNGKFYPYVTAFVFEKDRSGSGSDPTMSLQCYDRLYWLDQNVATPKVYRKDSKHPRGWTSTEIIRHLARAAGIPLGTIHATTYRHGRFEVKDADGDSILKDMYRILALDKKKSGRKAQYYIHMRNGKLNVVKQPSKPKSAYMIDETSTLETGSMRESYGDKFATRLTVKGKQSYSGSTTRGTTTRLVKKASVTVNPVDPAYQRAFGIIHKTYNLKGTHSKAGVLRLAKNELAKRVKPDKEFSITTRGIPGLWPGTKVYCISKYHGVKGLVKIKSISYSLDGKQFSMDLGLEVTTQTTLSTNSIKLLYSKAPIRY